MKKLQSLLLLGFLMILAACSNDELIAPDAPTGQTITVTIPGSDSRAIADYGQGTNVNRCILDIYHNGEVYGTRHIATVTDGKATFTDLRLVASQTYDFVFWADCADGQTDKYFDTSDLQKISFKNYTGNQDAFDAFFKTETFTVTEAFTKTVELRRPFGQLNIKTLDVDQIFKDELKPAKVKVEFTAVPTQFNARSGEVSNEQAVSYEADMEDAATGEISVDYIFAAVDEASLADFAITLYNAAGEVITKNADFTSIPIRRNYRTNITGNLLTKQGAFNVIVVPDFYTPDIDKEITEVSTVEEANAALAAGKTDIIVAEVKADDELIIPKTDTAVEKISVTLPETNEAVTVSYGEGTAAPTEVVITMPKSENLTINLPESTVTLNGAAYNNVTATVSENTLIIPAGTTVANLTVNKGNVEIYGSVTNPIKLAENSTVKVWEVRTIKELQAAGQTGADLVILKNDIVATTEDIYVTTPKFKVLDLNEMELSVLLMWIQGVGTYDVTIKNGTMNCNGSNVVAVWLKANNSKLTMDNVKFDDIKNGGSPAISIGDKDTYNSNTFIANDCVLNAFGPVIQSLGKDQNFTIDNTSIRSDDYVCITQNGAYAGSSFTVTNSTLYGEYCGIYLSNTTNLSYNNLTVDNCDINGGVESAIEVKKCNISVKNTKLASKEKTQTYKLNGGGTGGFGYGIVLAGYAKDVAYEGTTTFENNTYDLAAGADAIRILKYDGTTGVDFEKTAE